MDEDDKFAARIFAGTCVVAVGVVALCILALIVGREYRDILSIAFIAVPCVVAFIVGALFGYDEGWSDGRSAGWVTAVKSPQATVPGRIIAILESLSLDHYYAASEREYYAVCLPEDARFGPTTYLTDDGRLHVVTHESAIPSGAVRKGIHE